MGPRAGSRIRRQDLKKPKSNKKTSAPKNCNKLLIFFQATNTLLYFPHVVFNFFIYYRYQVLRFWVEYRIILIRFRVCKQKKFNFLLKN